MESDENSQSELEKQLLDLMRQGRKIDAIKLYRERTHQGLKEAKDAVEALASHHGIPVTRSGCAGLVLLLLAALSTAAATVALVMGF